MTDERLAALMQEANDKLQLLRDQCTTAQNQLVNMGAQYLAEQRKAEALTKRVAELEAQIADLTPPAKANGHDEHASA